MTLMTEPLAVRRAEDILTEARDVIEPAYAGALGKLPESLRSIAAYHRAEGGKALRPALVLCCAEAAGGDRQRAVRCAVAVELVHDFTLLHDDIMDGDGTRRGQPSAWAVFGTGPALLAGDALLALAYDLTADGSFAAVLARTVVELCHGQSADLTAAAQAGITLRDCEATAMAKTGALLGCACELGAREAGAPDLVALGLREFGRQLGLAFQLIDDLLGIYGDPAVTGKPAGADLAARKVSLPVAAALTSGLPAGAELAALYQSGPLDAAAVRRAADLVEQAGGRDWAQAQASSRTRSALAALAGLALEPVPLAGLTALAGYLTSRSH